MEIQGRRGRSSNLHGKLSHEAPAKWCKMATRWPVQGGAWDYIWFTKEEDPPQLDDLKSCTSHCYVFFPMLKTVPYRFRRAGGPEHQVIIPLRIDEPKNRRKMAHFTIPQYRITELNFSTEGAMTMISVSPVPFMLC